MKTTVDINKVENLKSVDITELKTRLGTFHKFLLEILSDIIGTEKEYNRRFCKVMESDGEKFTLNVDINKNRISDTLVDYMLRDSLSDTCVEFSDDYVDIKDLEEALASVEKNVGKIKK